MRTISTAVYTYSELAPKAQAVARDWFRETDDFDPEYDDFISICAMLGVEVASRKERGSNGREYRRPSIFWTGFASQGDGASFEASYKHAHGAPAAIRAHAPYDPRLHAIADRLQAVQSTHSFDLTATVSQDGRYCHEMTMSAEVEYTGTPAPAPAAEIILECMRDLARWLYRSLEDEYNYRRSDEAVAEDIEANEYEFTANGRRCVAL
jgi:hypothetical protein